MPRTASDIIARAGQIAKVGNISATGVFSGYKTQALDELNSLSDHIAQTVDFASAMAQFNFTFATALISSGAGNIIQAAPNPLPLDYLRVQTSGGSTGAQRSSIWYLQGVPYPMIEIDLTEWDNQVQQAGVQSYPSRWAKDMSQRAIIANIQGDITTASATVSNVSSTAGLVAGMSIAGGIGPLSIITPGTTITAVGASSLTLSVPPSVPSGAAISQTQASLMVGYPPVGLPYPPPSGAYSVRIRYQRLMPPLTQAQVDAGAYFWFDDDTVVIDGLAARLMGYSGDDRQQTYEAKAEGALAKYTKLADDKSNRGQTVQLDRRYFGGNYEDLKNTKFVGW